MIGAYQKYAAYGMLLDDADKIAVFIQPNIAEQVTVLPAKLLHGEKQLCVAGCGVVPDVVLVLAHDKQNVLSGFGYGLRIALAGSHKGTHCAFQ